MEKWFFVSVSLLLLSILPLPCFSAHHNKRHRFREAQKNQVAFDANLFLKKLHEEAPDWMSKQIQQDLALYAETGISKELLDTAFVEDRISACMLVRFHIKNGHLSCSRARPDGRLEPILAALNTLNQLTMLPDLDFVISLADSLEKNDLPYCPCFVFAKKKNADTFVLIPDFEALGWRRQLRNSICRGNQAIPWEQKTAQAFWRGSTTGGFFSDTAWSFFPRSTLVFLSLQYPDLIDARFTQGVQCTPKVAKLLESFSMLSQNVTEITHLQYKYLIDVDGNSCSYARCFWILLSNSLLIKQETANIQWYYGAMRPYEHYLPVKEDLSDLIQKIIWAQEHDAEAKALAEAGSEFAKTHLSSEDTLLYLYHLIMAYASLQKP